MWTGRPLLCEIANLFDSLLLETIFPPGINLVKGAEKSISQDDGLHYSDVCLVGHESLYVRVITAASANLKACSVPGEVESDTSGPGSHRHCLLPFVPDGDEPHLRHLHNPPAQRCANKEHHVKESQVKYLSVYRVGPFAYSCWLEPTSAEACIMYLYCATFGGFRVKN